MYFASRIDKATLVVSYITKRLVFLGTSTNIHWNFTYYFSSFTNCF